MPGTRPPTTTQLSHLRPFRPFPCFLHERRASLSCGCQLSKTLSSGPFRSSWCLWSCHTHSSNEAPHRAQRANVSITRFLKVSPVRERGWCCGWRDSRMFHLVVKPSVCCLVVVANPACRAPHHLKHFHSRARCLCKDPTTAQPPVSLLMPAAPAQPHTNTRPDTRVIMPHPRHRCCRLEQLFQQGETADWPP